MTKLNGLVNKKPEEIKKYVRILEDLNGKKKYTNYEILKKDLLVNFGVKMSIVEIKQSV